MAVPTLKSNVQIAFPVDEDCIELWPKKTVADIIATGDPLWFDTSGVEVVTGNAPDATLFVGIALEASNGTADSGYIRVAYKCVVQLLMDASGVTYPGKAIATSAGTGTTHRWTWTAATAEAYGYAKEIIPASSRGLVHIDRDAIAVNTIRETITT